MALTFEEVTRLKYETGYNVVGVGAEVFIAGGYAAVFDQAIRPYLVDFGTTSSTPIAAGAGQATITLAANPTIQGPTGPVANSYGLAFQQGSKLVLDVGPNREANVFLLSLSGLVATIAPVALAHGAYTYPVLLQGGEWIIRDIFARLDTLNGQISGYAPVVAGIAQADEVRFFASQRGKRGQKGVMDDLLEQRDLARKDLCSALGIPNLWEMRGKRGGQGGADLSYERH